MPLKGEKITFECSNFNQPAGKRRFVEIVQRVQEQLQREPSMKKFTESNILSESSSSKISLSVEDVHKFDSLLTEESEENKKARSSFLCGLPTGSTQVRLKFETYLLNGDTSKLFEVKDDFLAVRIMNMFDPKIWKIDSKNRKREENLLHFFITNNFKASLAFLLCHKSPHVQEMILEKNSAGKTPLIVSMTSLRQYSANFSFKIWELMTRHQEARLQEHLQNVDLLQACAEARSYELLLTIAERTEKRNILKPTAGGRTVLDLCQDQEVVFKILQLLMPLTDVEDDMCRIRDNAKEKNLLHHWSSQNFYEVIDFFRRAVSAATFKQMLEEKSKNGSNALMVAAAHGSKECLQIFLHFISLEMSFNVHNKAKEEILHTKNNYDSTLLSLVLQQGQKLEVSKHILLEWEKQAHKVEAKGHTEEIQVKKKALTLCMRKHLKPSDEVQKALRDVDNSLKKKQSKMIFIWVTVFFQCLVLPSALLLLDALPDMILVESYRQDWYESISWNETMHNRNFDTCLRDNCSTEMKFVCFPHKLQRFPKFVYALLFVLSPWIFYFFEYLHSPSFGEFQKVTDQRNPA